MHSQGDPSYSYNLHSDATAEDWSTAHRHGKGKRNQTSAGWPPSGGWEGNVAAADLAVASKQILISKRNFT